MSRGLDRLPWWCRDRLTVEPAAVCVGFIVALLGLAALFWAFRSGHPL